MGRRKGSGGILNPRTGKTYFDGQGEPEIQNVLQRYLKAGMTFYDVGANIGLFSLIAARLREHVAHNELARPAWGRKPVWSEPKPVFFARTDPKTSPDRGLGCVVETFAEVDIQVNTVSLDQFACTHPALDFIKCDVEGAEVEVFRGARRLLREKRPGIVCEMHSEENHRALVALFAEFAYASTNCGTNHILALPR